MSSKDNTSGKKKNSSARKPSSRAAAIAGNKKINEELTSSGEEDHAEKEDSSAEENINYVKTEISEGLLSKGRRVCLVEDDDNAFEAKVAKVTKSSYEFEWQNEDGETETAELSFGSKEDVLIVYRGMVLPYNKVCDLHEVIPNKADILESFTVCVLVPAKGGESDCYAAIESIHGTKDKGVFSCKLVGKKKSVRTSSVFITEKLEEATQKKKVKAPKKKKKKAPSKAAAKSKKKKGNDSDSDEFELGPEVDDEDESFAADTESEDEVSTKKKKKSSKRKKNEAGEEQPSEEKPPKKSRKQNKENETAKGSRRGGSKASAQPAGAERPKRGLNDSASGGGNSNGGGSRNAPRGDSNTPTTNGGGGGSRNAPRGDSSTTGGGGGSNTSATSGGGGSNTSATGGGGGSNTSATGGRGSDSRQLARNSSSTTDNEDGDKVLLLELSSERKEEMNQLAKRQGLRIVEHQKEKHQVDVKKHRESNEYKEQVNDIKQLDSRIGRLKESKALLDDDMVTAVSGIDKQIKEEQQNKDKIVESWIFEDGCLKAKHTQLLRALLIRTKLGGHVAETPQGNAVMPIPQEVTDAWNEYIEQEHVAKIDG